MYRIYFPSLHCAVVSNDRAHLHPRSQGLQIYSLHHRCQGSSWSRKVCCGRHMELRRRRSSYRMARGGQLLAPEGRVPDVSHNIRHMPSPGSHFYLHKNTPNHTYRQYTVDMPYLIKWICHMPKPDVKYVVKWIHQRWNAYLWNVIGYRLELQLYFS